MNGFTFLFVFDDDCVTCHMRENDVSGDASEA